MPRNMQISYKIDHKIQFYLGLFYTKYVMELPLVATSKTMSLYLTWQFWTTFSYLGTKFPKLSRSSLWDTKPVWI